MSGAKVLVIKCGHENMCVCARGYGHRICYRHQIVAHMDVTGTGLMDCPVAYQTQHLMSSNRTGLLLHIRHGIQPQAMALIYCISDVAFDLKQWHRPAAYQMWYSTSSNDIGLLSHIRYSI